LAIAFDDVDEYTRLVKVVICLEPLFQPIAVVRLSSLGENDGLIGGHVETFGKCLVVEWSNSLLVDV
jgi:hypothetical protein